MRDNIEEITAEEIEHIYQDKLADEAQDDGGNLITAEELEGK